MSALLTLIYHEFCKARLAEMRKHLSLAMNMRKGNPGAVLLTTILMAVAIWETMGPPPSHTKPVVKPRFAGPLRN